jgi:small-conductance mechanosensitive channel
LLVAAQHSHILNFDQVLLLRFLELPEGGVGTVLLLERGQNDLRWNVCHESLSVTFSFDGTPLEVVVDDLGDNGVRLLALPYVATDNCGAVRNDMRELVKARFDAIGIRFALPERNVHFLQTDHPGVAAHLPTTDHYADR